MNKNGIALSNKEEIKKVLDEAQKRCTARTITIDDIVAVCHAVEDKLEISKKALAGTEVKANINSQKFASSYKGIPESTYFCAKYSVSTGWRVISIYRANCNQHTGYIKLSESAKEALIATAERANWLQDAYYNAIEKMNED